MNYEFSLGFAREMDKKDELAAFRQEFLIPEHNGKPALYFTGNSLGLQPKDAKNAILVELEDWAKYGVEGHFEARNPWFSYHERFTAQTAELVGALPIEVVLMNGLSANLHFMMVSFFQPSGKRTKILCEKKAFPSDQYAIESQLRFHGLDPAKHLIEVGPIEGEHLISDQAIIQAIQDNAEEIALVMIGGVNYYSGQVFDMASITKAAHTAGAFVGFDLAHGVGNIPLKLHEWGPDFACWCSYKYLNSGPGSISGVFVHERHSDNDQLPRFAGWWGHDKDARFKMESGFKPIKGAEGWQLSNAPVFAMAIHKVSLDLFTKAGMPKLRQKSILLSGYMEFIINEISNAGSNKGFEIITPSESNRRGCQLSLLAHGHGKSLFDKLTAKGVISDWREPNVIRVAPVPLYNSFEDIYSFGKALEESIK
jgi:kynureninase